MKNLPWLLIAFVVAAISTVGVVILAAWLGGKPEFTIWEDEPFPQPALTIPAEGDKKTCDYCDSDEYLYINFKLRYGEAYYRPIRICQEDMKVP